MRKNILILISVILVGILIIYTFKPQESTKEMHSKKTHLVTSLKLTTKPTHLPKATRPSKPSKKSPQTSETLASEIPSTQMHVLYKTLPLEEAKLITKEKRHIQPITAIALNKDTFSNLKTGDTLTLPDIDGIDYTLNVIDLQTHKNGATSTTAQYEDEGVTYTTTITHSENETFITLATAQGMYEIETSQGVGYVYESSQIRKQLQHSRKNDVIVLPVPKK